MSDFQKTIADLKSGSAKRPSFRPFLASDNVQDSLKPIISRVNISGRSTPMPTDAFNLSPSEMLVMKVKSKINQQILPESFERIPIKPLVEAVNREERPRRIQLNTADSMPSFECPFNMIKNLQKIQAERLMKEHAEEICKRKTSNGNNGNFLANGGASRRSRSLMDLDAKTRRQNAQTSDLNENNNESVIYRDIMYYLTGQTKLSRGSIEEFHRASQPDLFLLCISKMRSDEAIATKNSLEIEYEKTEEQHFDVVENCLSTNKDIQKEKRDDVSVGLFDTEINFELGMANHRAIKNYEISTDDNDDNAVDKYENKHSTDTATGDKKNTDSAIVQISSVNTNIEGKMTKTEEDYTHNHPSKKRLLEDDNITIKNLNVNANSVHGCPNTNIVHSNINMNRCDNPCTSASSQNHIAPYQQTPLLTHAYPTPGPNIPMDESQFMCSPDIHWSIYIKHITKKVELSVKSTEAVLPVMTPEQLDIYKQFVNHLAFLHRKGVDISEVPSELSNGSTQPSADAQFMLPTYTKPFACTNNNNPPVDDLVYPCMYYKSLRPPNEYKKLENDKLVRLQIENTGLRIKNRDLILKLKRAEDILKLGQGDNEEGSLVDKLLKNAQYYMAELDRVNASLNHEKTVVKDLDHAQQQLIDDYTRRENELEVQIDRLMNETETLKEKLCMRSSDIDTHQADKHKLEDKIHCMEDELHKVKNKAETVVKELQDEYQGSSFANEREKEALTEDLKRMTDDYNWAMGERENMEKENNELSEENAAQAQFINELKVDLAVNQNKADVATELEERLDLAERTIQEQTENLYEWEQEYGMISRRMNELVEAASELKSENHTLRHHMTQLDTELDELAEVNIRLREQLEDANEDDVSQGHTENASKGGHERSTRLSFQAEAEKEAEKYRKAVKALSKDAEKAHSLKEQLHALQNVYTTYQQHMNFKYKNIVKEFKKKVSYYEAENTRQSSQLQNVIFTNDSVNQALAMRNVELAKAQQCLATAENEVKTLKSQLQKAEEAFALEQNQQAALANQNMDLLEKMKTMQAEAAQKARDHKLHSERDSLPSYVKHLNKIVVSMAEQIQNLDASHRHKNENHSGKTDSENINHFKKTIQRLETDLNTERMLHEITKTHLRSAEEDLTRLRHTSRSIHTKTTSSETRMANRTEQVARKIHQAQIRTQQNGHFTGRPHSMAENSYDSLVHSNSNTGGSHSAHSSASVI